MTEQSFPAGQHSAEAVPVLLSIKQFVDDGQHQPDGSEEPHVARPLDVHVSRPINPNTCAASTAATRADAAGTVAEKAQIAANFWSVENAMMGFNVARNNYNIV